MRNKLGIIQLELPDIELGSPYDDKSRTEITDLLNEEQKEIIKTLGGSKLVLLNVKVVDSNGVLIIFNGLCIKGEEELICYSLNRYDDVSSSITLFEETGEYYIYS